MTIAQFGKKQFTVGRNKIYTFKGFSYSTKLATEKQEASGKKPSTNIKGAELISISMTLPLQSNLGVDVRLEMESWEQIQNAAVPELFMLGNKTLSINKFLLTDMSVSNITVDGKGKILSAEIKLSFTEYLPPMAQPKAAGTSSGGASPYGIKANDAYQVMSYSEWEKAQKKKHGEMTRIYGIDYDKPGKGH